MAVDVQWFVALSGVLFAIGAGEVARDQAHRLVEEEGAEHEH